MSAGLHSLRSGRHRRILCTVALAMSSLILGCADPPSPEHRAAISKLQGLGGRVVFNDGGYRVNLGGSRVADEDLPALLDIQNLNYIDLQQTTITDAGLESLAKIEPPCTIMLGATRTTSDGRKKLREAQPELRVVD